MNQLLNAIQFLFAPANAPFTISILIMLGLALVEFLGGVFSSLEMDFGIGHDISIDHGAHVGHGDSDFDADGFSVLGWLGIGQVPLVITLVSALTLFGASGLLIQQVCQSLFSSYLPLLIAVPVAFVLMLPLLGLTSGLLMRISPPTESYAVDPASFVGKRARLLGNASPDRVVKATITDQYGTQHYVQVQSNEGTLPEGGDCLLWKREGNVFIAIATSESTYTSPF